MASDAIGGAITFSTAIDNSDLEKGLEDAQKRVEELKKQLEEKEAAKSAIEEQLDKANESIDNTINEIDRLKAEMESLKDVDPADPEAWWNAAQQIADNQQKVVELNEALKEQESTHAELLGQYREMETQVAEYQTKLESATTQASELSQRVSSFYHQAGMAMRTSMDNVTESVSKLGDRIGRLVSSAMVFSVITKALNTVKQGIAEALMQNDSFSASWAYLQATMQGFANGIANAVAPMLVQVINGVTACVMTLARAIDSVFKTSLASSIDQARKSAQEAWRQTDESKAASKEADKNAKAREKQQEQYAKAQEKYAEQQRKAQERAQKAQESLDKRRAKAEQKYPDALEEAAERQAKAEQDAAEKRAKAEETAQERMEKAQAKAQERQSKAEESAAEKNAAAQEAYEKRVAAAEAKEAAAKERWDKKQAKAAAKLEKAQKKANETVLGFDELNKMNAEATSDATDEMEEYSSTVADIEPPKTYGIDPEDYIIDPSDYAVDYDKYQIDPEDFFVDPEDYAFDPSEYVIDPEDYAVDPFSFDWTDIPEISAEEGLKPNWDAFDVGKIDEKVSAIMAIMGGALLAIGAVLAFSGINIPLGLALMAVGALELATVIGENWNKLPEETRQAITTALTITGIVLIVVGAILAFSGVAIPLGVGLMAAGFLMEWSVVALNWNSLTPEMQTTVATLMGILSGAFFVIGAILLFAVPTMQGLGIGLMALGAAGMAASVALVWGSLDPQLQQTLTNLMVTVGMFAIVIGVVLLVAVPGMQGLGVGLILSGIAMLGAAVALNWETLGETLRPALVNALNIIGTLCLVIGVVLLFVPGQLPLGIGLIIGGIAALTVSEMAADWESLNTTLGDALGHLLETIAHAMLILGVILLFVPGQQALAIGLIIGGIAVLAASEVALNWESLNTDLGSTLATIAQTIAGYMIILGVILCFAQQWPLAIGLIIGGIAILAVSEASQFDWSSLDGKLNEVLGGVLKTVGTFMIVIGVILCFAQMWPIAIGLIIGGIAALAVGEVAVNWDSLNTTLGDALKGVVQTIAGAMLVIGLLLAVTGVALPIGLGLIVAGIGILAVSEIPVDWDFLKNKVKEIWEAIKQWWSSGPAKIFTAEWWTNLFKCIVNAFVGIINGIVEAWNNFWGGISDALGNLAGATGGSFEGGGTVPSVRPPGLARGAVIPPNRQFMAVLGDQRSGNNIETPESLMRQVVREEAGGMMAEMMMQMQAMGAGVDGGGDTNLTLYIDSEELARATAKGSSSLTRRGVLSPSATFV
jgi:hypothetical protein